MVNGKWDPFQNGDELESSISRLFEDSFAPKAEGKDGDGAFPDGWNPAVDIYRNEEGIVIKADLPGVQKEDVSIEIKGNMVTLRGERCLDETECFDDYCRQECPCGVFMRTFNMQTVVNPETVSASFKNGILRITIQNPGEEETRRIKVDVD
jgi:HSP20 family protein